jgi:hypothetical protein
MTTTPPLYKLSSSTQTTVETDIVQAQRNLESLPTARLQGPVCHSRHREQNPEFLFRDLAVVTVEMCVT